MNNLSGRPIMSFELMPLPYPKEALGESMSAETLEFHHGKHHRAYVDKVNQMLADQPSTELSLIDVVRSAHLQNDIPLFNNSAQIWNHNFFWNCLAPPTGQGPVGQLAKMIEQSFGSIEALLLTMRQEAVSHFSNGWAWLVLDHGVLRVTSLHDADTPLVHEKMKPLLTLDVWEHAYYVDYRNARASYANRVLGNIINWEFVAENLDGAGDTRADQMGRSAALA
jgi:Fe-Mn family superoxide dismutase